MPYHSIRTVSSELHQVTVASHSEDDDDSITPSPTQTWKWLDKTEVNARQSFMRFITTIGSKPGVLISVVQNVAKSLVVWYMR
jgi:hypothetical protein